MQPPQLPFAPFRNEGLFTDHYLLHVLPQAAEMWSAEGLEEFRARLSALWAEQRDRVAGYNEAQLEEHFIRPVLRLLGHVWEVQPAAGNHQPDYGFFAGEAARDEARDADPAGGKAYWAHALAW